MFGAFVGAGGGHRAAAGAVVDWARDGRQTRPPHDMAAMSLFSNRDASGTTWLPDVTPMYGVHKAAGSWRLMFHGNAFGQFFCETGYVSGLQTGNGRCLTSPILLFLSQLPSVVAGRVRLICRVRESCDNQAA